MLEQSLLFCPADIVDILASKLECGQNARTKSTVLADQVKTAFLFYYYSCDSDFLNSFIL